MAIIVAMPFVLETKISEVAAGSTQTSIERVRNPRERKHDLIRTCMPGLQNREVPKYSFEEQNPHSTCAIFNGRECTRPLLLWDLD